MTELTPFRTYNHSKPETWATHYERFEIWADSRGITADTQRRGLLLDTLGDTTLRNLKTWLHPRTIRDSTYEQIILKLDEKITPAVNWLVRFSSLRRRTQRADESAAEFMADIKALADSCGFGEATQRLVLAQFVTGLRDAVTQTRLINLHATLTSDEALAKVIMVEQGRLNSEVVRNGTAAEQGTDVAVHRTSWEEERSNRRTLQGDESVNVAGGSTSDTQRYPTSNKRKIECFRCGENHRQCNKQWKNFKCDKCLRMGHLAKVCLANGPRRRNQRQPNQQEENDLPHASTSTHHFTREAERPEYPSSLFMVKPAEPITDEIMMKPIIVDVTVNGKPVPFELDTGATCSLISLQTLTQLYTDDSKPELYHSNIILSTWGQAAMLKVVGRFHAQVTYQGRTSRLPILVGEENGPNLLGRNWFYPLCISVQGVHQLLTVDNAQGNDGAFDYIKLPAVTGEGTGRYTGPPIHLDLKPDARPVYHRARPVPFALKTRMEEDINHNVERGISVPMQYAEGWATAIVPVERKNGAPLRLFGDYRSTVNPALPSDSYQTSTTDAVIIDLRSGNTVFAEIDLAEAFAQLSVDTPTSRLLAVNTQRGLFRVTALPFGIKLASAIFQRVVDAVIGSLPGTLAYQDNIFVAAPNRDILRRRLYNVLKALGDAGLRVNRDKCTWETDSLIVLGFLVDRSGVRPVPERVQAIKEAPPPQNVKELQHLLGLISFYSRFFADKATILDPLHRLLDNGAPWSWTRVHQQALDQVKDLLSSDQVLIHYSLQLPLSITVDASSYGVGAILSHQVKHKGVMVERPIQYASRTMSQTERRYAQLDREALAVIFGITKFNQFIQARSFTIITDHKPLLGIFNPTARIPLHVSPRMLRWILMLLAYDYAITYKPGKAIAHVDYISRMPIPVTHPPEDVIPASIYLFEARDLEALSAKDIATATQQDPILRKVILWTQRGWPDNVPEDFQLYWQKREELSVVSDCLQWCLIACSGITESSYHFRFGPRYCKSSTRLI